MRDPIRICFVCLGNIVRSPLAENLFAQLTQQKGVAENYVVDSAGTGGWHIGEPPDPRISRVAARHGITLRGQARQFRRDDFERYDLIIVMDRDIHDSLFKMAPSEKARAKITMLREYDPLGTPRADVPDPYYGGLGGFEEVYQIVERSCRGLLVSLENEKRASNL